MKLPRQRLASQARARPARRPRRGYQPFLRPPSHPGLAWNAPAGAAISHQPSSGYAAPTRGQEVIVRQALLALVVVAAIAVPVASAVTPAQYRARLRAACSRADQRSQAIANPTT